MAADNSRIGTGWKIATVALAVASIPTGAFAFAQHRSASALTQQLAAATSETAQLRSQLGAAQTHAADLQQQLASTQQQVSSQQAELQDTKTQLTAESRPDLPLRVSFRQALLEQGEVGVFQNLSNRILQVTLDVTSPATGATMHRSLTINPRAMVQVGPLQQWPFAPGQRFEVSNPSFRPIVGTVRG